MKKEGFKERLRERAVNALLHCRSIASAAKRVRVSERTLRRWLADENFYGEYQAAKRELARAGNARLAMNRVLAADTLAEVAKHKGRKFQAPRANAAANIIKLAMDADVIEDLQERVRKLERQGKSGANFSLD
jgi:Helix-turn-helix domain